jgi:hypothetical protein
MRGAFNNTCDLFYGPHSPYGPPGVQYLSGVPCRFVPQLEILQGDFPLTLTVAWLTTESVEPNIPQYGSVALGEWHADIETADVVAVPSGSTDLYYAIRRETVTPFGQPSYTRVMLLPADSVNPGHWLPPSPPPPPPPPPPPAPPLPGTSCATATALVDGQVTLFTIPATGVAGWVTFDYSASGICFYSTCGVRGGCAYELWLGPDCSGLVDQGLFNEDVYLPIFDMVGNRLFMQFQNTQGVDQVVAICASQSIL